MAEILDVDPDQRALARRVPDAIRQNLTPLELRFRLEEAQALLVDAEGAGDRVKADRLRARAGKLLRAASPSAYQFTLDTLSGQLRQARLDGADRKAWEIESEIRAFENRNPQVSQERLLTAAEAAIQRQINAVAASPPKSRLFDRRNHRKTR